MLFAALYWLYLYVCFGKFGRCLLPCPLVIQALAHPFTLSLRGPGKRPTDGHARPPTHPLNLQPQVQAAVNYLNCLSGYLEDLFTSLTRWVLCVDEEEAWP